MKYILVFSMLLMFGCSLKNPNDLNSNKVFIKIEKQRNLNEPAQLFSSASLTNLFLSSNANGDPQTIDEFNCFAINVTGSGILPNNDLHGCSILQPFNMNGMGVGKISEMSPSGSAIQLDVQPGFNRRIDVYGVYPTTVACNDNDEIPVAQKGYYVGGLTTDLLGDTSVSIPVSYSQSNPNKAIVCDKDLFMKFGTLSAGHRIYYSQASSGPFSPTPYPTASPTPSSTDVTNISSGDDYYVTSDGGSSASGYVEVHFNVTNIISNEFNGIEVMVNAFTNNLGSKSSVNAQLYNTSGTPQYETAVGGQYEFYISQSNLANLNSYIWTDSNAQNNGLPYKFIVVKITASQVGTSYVASVNEVRLRLHKKPQ